MTKIQGNYPLTGIGWDYNQDGIFDNVSKFRSSDIFKVSDLENELYKVRDRVTNNPEKIETKNLNLGLSF